MKDSRSVCVYLSGACRETFEFTINARSCGSDSSELLNGLFEQFALDPLIVQPNLPGGSRKFILIESARVRRN